MLNRTGHQGNVYQAHQRGKWNPRSSAYGRFWVDVPSGERKRRTTQWVARLRLREYIERAGVCSKRRFHQIPVPGTTFRHQAEWWMESLSTRRRRPLKPATVYGWQHCLNRWILPNLANKLVSEVGNGALRQFVEILSAAGLAPKTIVNVVTVVKFVVASAVDEEGDQIHPRVWSHEFMQLPLVVPTITEAEISAMLTTLKGRDAVLVALVARKAGVPDDLIKLWLGHSQNLIDLYAAQLRYDETYRREWCEKAGLGFELGELGYKSVAPIRPLLVA